MLAYVYSLVLRRVHSSILFFFNDTATTEIYTLSLHDALPICRGCEWHTHVPVTLLRGMRDDVPLDDWLQKRSEEQTSELQSQSNLVCRLLLEKKKQNRIRIHITDDINTIRTCTIAQHRTL